MYMNAEQISLLISDFILRKKIKYKITAKVCSYSWLGLCHQITACGSYVASAKLIGTKLFNNHLADF